MNEVHASGSATRAFRGARDGLVSLRDDHERAVTEFEWPDLGPTFNWAHDWFDATAENNENPALVIVEENGAESAYTFSEMRRRSDQVATYLLGKSIGEGSVVAVMLPNRVELWDVMLAAMKVGAVVVPTAPGAPPGELKDRVERARIAMVVCEASDFDRLQELGIPDLQVVCADDHERAGALLQQAYGRPSTPTAHPGTPSSAPLLLYFTSGTTSRPKLVEHTQVSYPVGHLSTMYWIGLREGDRHLNISSPGWAKHAWSSFFAPWNAGATIVVFNYKRFNPREFLGQLRERRVSSLCAPPTVWRMLIQAELGTRPSQLRELVSAGEPLNAEVIETVERAWGLTIRDGFGQTEMTAAVGNSPGDSVVPGSMGKPLPGVPVVLVSTSDGRVVTGPGEGELCLDLGAKPLSLMVGYRDDEVRQAEATRDGFYHTGDVVTRDAEGRLTFVGRTDDVFKSSDYKISPFELESALIEHPAVAEAAVVPIPDPIRLTVPKAFITLADGFTGDRACALSIFAHAREGLAHYQRIRALEFGDLPKTMSGKIRRVELRNTGLAGETQEWRYADFAELTEGGASGSP